VNPEVTVLVKPTSGYCLISIVSQKRVLNERFSFLSSGIHECEWSSISSNAVSGQCPVTRVIGSLKLGALFHFSLMF
jgi:hypothetical protein